MCSVVGCLLGRRPVQRFKLPEDPERRLEWVQFLATVNKQRFKESSWTDITICSEHFEDGCFENVTACVSREAGGEQLTLKPGAVPSLRVRSDEPEPNPGAQRREEVATDKTHSRIPGVPQICAVIDEESESVDETGESNEQTDMDSDDDWESGNKFWGVREVQKDIEDTESEEEEDDGCLSLTSTYRRLCTDCGKFYSQCRRHMCEHKTKPYCCNICGKRCVSETALNSHSRIHNENYVHRCKYCYVTFKTKADKFNHEQSHMTQGKPYKCPDCSDTFGTNKQRRIHLQEHRGVPQLKCHICGIEFRSPQYLQRHSAVHTGEKPFKCSVCQRGFNQAGHLKSHMRLHTGERPFKCQHCDKCFNHNVSLKSHVQRYHTSNPGCEQRERINTRESNTGGAVCIGHKRGTDSEHDNVELEEETEEEMHRERRDKPKSPRSSGRPIGRPKRQCSNLKIKKHQAQKKTKEKQKKTQDMDKKNQELSCSDASCDSGEEEEEGSTKAVNGNTRMLVDSETDERKKKRYINLNGGRTLTKHRRRPRKNEVVHRRKKLNNMV